MAAVGSQPKQLLDGGGSFGGELGGGGQQDGGAAGAVLGLSDQIDGGHFGIAGIVGDDQRLGGTGQQIDADASEQLALGFGDVGVAGADDHVDRRDALGAQRHGGDGLHASDGVDFIGSAQVHRGDDGGMRRALERRRGGDDALHARGLRGDDAHVRRGHHGIASAGHVAADAIHRNVLVAEHDAGQRFDFDVLQRGPLHQGEVADLRLRELDVFDHLARQGRGRTRRFRVSESRNDGGDHLSNFSEYCRTAFSPCARDVGEDGLDRVADLQSCSPLSWRRTGRFSNTESCLMVLLGVYFLAGAGSGGGSGAGFS